ncbi:glycosyltransferase [Streptomyces sp. NPDC008139]|uniref:glycosyltransferase n=1 Tax=Streptomyces sp. NPDC008139 TaxID=3364814 RepID=UPI0036E0B198
MPTRATPSSCPCTSGPRDSTGCSPASGPASASSWTTDRGTPTTSRTPPPSTAPNWSCWNRGPAAARNAAAGPHPYAVFVDSDIVLPPETVPVLLRHLTDPKVGMAVPCITGLPTAAATGAR